VRAGDVLVAAKPRGRATLWAARDGGDALIDAVRHAPRPLRLLLRRRPPPMPSALESPTSNYAAAVAAAAAAARASGGGGGTDEAAGSGESLDPRAEHGAMAVTREAFLRRQVPDAPHRLSPQASRPSPS